MINKRIQQNDTFQFDYSNERTKDIFRFYISNKVRKGRSTVVIDTFNLGSNSILYTSLNSLSIQIEHIINLTPNELEEIMDEIKRILLKQELIT